MTKVKSVEFQCEFGRYRAPALREAAVITNHGRDDVVLLGAGDHARFRRHEQKALHVSELPANVIEELDSVAIPKAAAKFNREYKKNKSAAVGISAQQVRRDGDAKCE